MWNTFYGMYDALYGMACRVAWFAHDLLQFETLIFKFSILKCNDDH